jgi:hypothetical protein
MNFIIILVYALALLVYLAVSALSLKRALQVKKLSPNVFKATLLMLFITFVLVLVGSYSLFQEFLF